MQIDGGVWCSLEDIKSKAKQTIKANEHLL